MKEVLFAISSPVAEQVILYTGDTLHSNTIRENDSEGKKILLKQTIALIGIQTLKWAGWCSKWNPMATSINYVIIHLIDQNMIVPLTHKVCDHWKIQKDDSLTYKAKFWGVRISLNGIINSLALNILLHTTYSLNPAAMIAVNLAIATVALAIWKLDSRPTKEITPIPLLL